MEDTIFKDHLKSIRPMTDTDFERLLQEQVARIHEELSKASVPNAASIRL